jgi:CheY-like chemotaxis protein
MSKEIIYQNLLIIDDDDDDQEIFISAVEKLSVSIHCNAICSAFEALEKLESDEIKPDLIFLDLNMPLMSGQQFLLEIKKIAKLSDIPVIIFSTSSHPQTIAITKELGALDFITKPSKITELVTILSRILFSKTN